MFLYAVMLLIQTFTVQIYIDLKMKEEVENIERNPENFKEKRKEVSVKLD